MTGCVSICVKNLAEVAKVTEWVGRKKEHNNDLLLGNVLALSIFRLNLLDKREKVNTSEQYLKLYLFLC